MKKFKKLLSVILALCMLMSILPISVLAFNNLSDGVFEAKNFFAASGASQNRHLNVLGIAIDKNDNAHIIIVNNASSDKDIRGVTLTYTNGTQYEVDYPTSTGETATLFDNKSTFRIELTGVGETLTFSPNGAQSFVVLPIGSRDNVTNKFDLDIDTSAGGWDIKGSSVGEGVQIQLAYEVIKEVDTVTVLPGDEITYTITVKNIGNGEITNIEVVDIVPEGITITGVNELGNLPEGYVQGSNITLADKNLILAVNGSKTYKIFATVNDDIASDTVIVNRAQIDCEELHATEDQATSKVEPYFKVYHGATKATEIIRIADLNNNPFNITEKIDGVYNGIPEGYLYGGTFESDFKTVATDFADGESGVEFTPVSSKTYYVHEPSVNHLRPAMASVWSKDRFVLPNTFKVTDSYLMTAVDRELYKEVGFGEYNDNGEFVEQTGINNEKLSGTTIYEKVMLQHDEDPENVLPVNANTLFFASGSYLASMQYGQYSSSAPQDLDDEIIPYWITLDGVRVTGDYKFTAVKYNGEGPTADEISTGVTEATKLIYKKLSVVSEKIAPTYTYVEPTAPAAQPMMVRSLFYAVAREPVAPEIPEDNTITITINGNETVKVEPGDISDELVYENVEGMIFAGWYADSEYTVPADLTDVQEDIEIYAKYVSDAYLNVQLPTSNGNGKINKLSLISAVDSTNYAEVGFVYVINGKETCVVADYAKSVKGLKAGYLFGDRDTAKLFTADINVKNLEKGTEIEITPYWVTNDGTTVYGTARTLTYNGRSVEG